MRNIYRILEAIADLETQERLNIKATAKKYKIKHKTLENRWKSKSVLIEKAVLTYH
jgi:hypothetical protein